MKKRKTRRYGSSGEMRAVLSRVLDSAFVSSEQFYPDEDGQVQLTLTGAASAVRNRVEFNELRLMKTLHSLPSVFSPTGWWLEKYAKRRMFSVMCGDYDRALYMIDAIRELVSSGITKMMLVADTYSERANLTRSLELMRGSLGNVDVLLYSPQGYSEEDIYAVESTVERFMLTSHPTLLVIGRDSFSRATNIIYARRDSGRLSDSIANTRPVVLTTSETVDSARTLARNAAVFEPSLTLSFIGEERPVRDAVIYSPAYAYNEEEAQPQTLRLEF